jgi:hypothetical protein
VPGAAETDIHIDCPAEATRLFVTRGENHVIA